MSYNGTNRRIVAKLSNYLLSGLTYFNSKCYLRVNKLCRTLKAACTGVRIALCVCCEKFPSFSVFDNVRFASSG